MELEEKEPESPVPGMEGCEAVEREVDKVETKFRGVQEHFDRHVDRLITFISELKAEYDNGTDEILTCNFEINGNEKCVK